ncbi:hypothetical protein [Rhodoferax sp.]|uniref:hypothetical protein n=1 Tax=Rhodoferax sp. TaxID=50421 RepID=UPI002758BC1B|nr:hypothetical protein [Rhodoferax sp.]
MASAPMKSVNGQLPTGFVSPFVRVAQQGTHDDLLACAAVLCGKTMADVKTMAVTLGMRANGPFYMDEVLFRKILFNLSNLAVSDYKDFTSLDALPMVAVLCVDYDANELCRHLIFHHVRATAEFASFSYLIDVANWIDDKQHVTTDFSHLNMKPAWYLEITQRPSPSGKAK